MFGLTTAVHRIKMVCIDGFRFSQKRGRKMDGIVDDAAVFKKYVCMCGYEYNEPVGIPAHGVKPGTSWEDIPADFTCPLCGLGKDFFEKT